MITRAIVTGTDYNNGKIQVRIPILEGIRNSRNAIVTEYSNSSASIVCIPGIDVDYKIGDIVVIGFEDNDAGMPIVLGHLMLRGDSIPQSRVYGRFIELSSSESFIAPTNTTIGSTTYQQLFNSVENLTNQSTVVHKPKPESHNTVEPEPEPEPTSIWNNALDSDGVLQPITESQIPDDSPFTIIEENIRRASNCKELLAEKDSHFNCYAYAIRTYDTSLEVQSDQSQFPIGRFTKDYDARLKGTRHLANQILKDLTSAVNPTEGTDPISDPEPLNKKNVRWTTKIPDLSDFNGVSSPYLFAFRVGYNQSGDVYDYHLMRYDGTEQGWSHKMGGFPTILQTINPWEIVDGSGKSAWSAECCSSEVPDGDEFVLIGSPGATTDKMLINPNTVYAGTIVYFSYED